MFFVWKNVANECKVKLKFKDKKDCNLNNFFMEWILKTFVNGVQNFIQKYVMQNSLLHMEKSRVTEDFSIVKKCASKFVHARKHFRRLFFKSWFTIWHWNILLLPDKLSYNSHFTFGLKYQFFHKFQDFDSLCKV